MDKPRFKMGELVIYDFKETGRVVARTYKAEDREWVYQLSGCGGTEYFEHQLYSEAEGHPWRPNNWGVW